MRVLRRLLRFMFWVTLVLGLPYAIWAIYNCFDEVETAQARHWGAPYSNVVPDKANAWLYLLGIGAAENDDPIAMGRRRLDAFETRRRMDPVPPAGVAEQAGPLPHIGPDRAVDGVNHLCDVRKTDCVAWTAQHAVMLDRLATANRVRLLRYETMLSMPHWDEKATPDTVSLDADFKIAFLHLDLLASGWRGGEDPQQVVAALAKTVSFWRRVAEQSHELLSKILAARLIEHGQRILGSIVERLSVAQLRSMQGDLDAILAPQTAMQADLEMVAKEEYLRFAAGTERDLRVGDHPARMRGGKREGQGGCTGGHWPLCDPCPGAARVRAASDPQSACGTRNGDGGVPVHAPRTVQDGLPSDAQRRLRGRARAGAASSEGQALGKLGLFRLQPRRQNSGGHVRTRSLPLQGSFARSGRRAEDAGDQAARPASASARDGDARISCRPAARIAQPVYRRTFWLGG